MSLRRLSFVLGLATLTASAATSIGCATSGNGGSTGNDSGAAGDDGGALDDGGQPKIDSGNPQGDSGVAGDSANPGDSGGACVKPPPASCGLAPQCGCGANQTCEVTDVMGDTACTGAGNATQGHACTTTGECVAGLTCVFGACRPYCAQMSGSACGVAGTGACQQVQNTSMVDIKNLKVCLISCALDDVSSCGGLPTIMTDPVATCAPTTPGATDCVKGGRSTTTCGGQNAPFCAPGYRCSNGTTCESWCKVGGTGQCGALTCGALMPAVTIGGIQYGSCR